MVDRDCGGGAETGCCRLRLRAEVSCHNLYVVLKKLVKKPVKQILIKYTYQSLKGH